MKIHDEDWLLAKDFLRATSFTTIYQGGRGIRHTVRDLATYDNAKEAAEQLEREHSTYGRRACIYAITSGFYGVCVTNEILHCVNELLKEAA